MATLCRPEVAVPEFIITREDTLKLAERLHARNPQLKLVLRLINGTGVQKRHIVQPLEQALAHPGFEIRNRIYEREAKRRVPPVIRQALENAELTARDIDAIIFVSCTGFMMPSMTAYLINAMGFRHDTRQIPMAQLGCAAGAAAISRAHDFCAAHAKANVLIVACEFCSLCYQPTDDDVGSLLSDGLFGDAVGAVVVRGSGGTGIRLERNEAYLIPDTEEWISYAVKDTGFHFRLDKRVPGTMKPLAPVMRRLVSSHGWDVGNLDFYIVHAGGPRILNDLCRYLEVPQESFRYSRATLTEYGNIASAVVLDSLGRLFADRPMPDGARGVIAGFGPGITAEMAVGSWVNDHGQSRGGARSSSAA
ncbi:MULTISPECIES: type III polyketide synthase [unclassified Sorangium]|uniref:type III polyketide synthase n=1 Tax=unclassified Sorangium TaxID=2621164 RepID=UPI003F6132CB